MALGGIDLWLNTIISGVGLGYTLKHGKTDAAATGKAADFKPIVYPKPDGKLTFDKLTNVSFSATNHEEDQPVHLKLAGSGRCRLPSICRCMPSQRSVTARQRVYEIVKDDKGDPKFQINAQNCVHCKTCDIKDPEPEY